MRKPIVVISAVNIKEGGPLSILKDAVEVFAKNYTNEYDLVLLLHKKELLDNIPGNIKVYAYRYPKVSWLLRAWFEYVHSYFISRRIEPYLWFSLHDMTPNVLACNKAVYCHNPAPFYRFDKKEAASERTLFFFHYFYHYFYRINIKKNKYVIVQQQWLRDEFIKRFKINNVVVANPDVCFPQFLYKREERDNVYRFFYPALPRAFKNFEIIFEAVLELQKKYTNFEVILTLSGNENKYAMQLLKKYGHLPNIKLIGLQDRNQIWELYNHCSCLVFPSKMETWGLPITEIKFFNKPVLVANCRYAYETVGNYDKACFFEKNDPENLSRLMLAAMNDTLVFHKPSFEKPVNPYVQSWKKLFKMLLSNEQPQTV